MIRSLASILIVLLFPLIIEGADYSFEGKMSREVLEKYLSRAVTHAGLCASHPSPETSTRIDDIRMLTKIGAKFIGRAAFVWDLPPDDNQHFLRARKAATQVHAEDPEIILQACVFEAVFPEVKKIPIPDWIFNEFGLQVEDRTFNYEAMLYRDGSRVGQWRKVGSVPDMSQLETRLWFYYRARRYIDCGMEAIHFGQVKIMDEADPDHRHWIDMLTRVRRYAKDNARRRFVLCDAHTHGEVEGEKLLFDFHSFPLRIEEIKDKPIQGHLVRHGAGKIYGRSKGGVTPSGWRCDSLPYLVEFDNWGYSGKGGKSVGGIWIWGYDEMSWFAHQDIDYQERWLRYAIGWLKKHDSKGFLQIPTRRKLAAPVKQEIRMFRANNPTESRTDGFGLEDRIHKIWRKK